MPKLRLPFPLHRPFTTAAATTTTATTTTTFTSLSHLVLTSTDPKSLSQTLLSTPFTEPLVNQTLKNLWNHGPKALQFFKILDKHINYSHSLSSYHHAIDIAARMQEYTTLWNLVARIQARRMGPTPLTFAIIMERYVQAKKVNKAVDIFMSMHKYGCPQDLNSFNTLLDILCKAKRVEQAHELMNNWKGRFKCDVVSYNVIANGWCLLKRVNKALDLLKEMVERGISPTLSTYNVILKGYFRCGRANEAWLFWKEMKRRKCEMDVVSYTTMIHGLGVVGEVSRAKRLFEEMVEEGVLPNVATYNAMIQVLCKKESVENAIGVLEEMGRKGYVANSMTYNGVIRGLCHVGEMERAIEMVEVMKRAGCRPNVHTWNLLIRYYCEGGEMEKGLEVLEGMGDWQCLPNKETYNVLISSSFRRKKAEDLVVAGTLLMEMVERGFIPTRFTFNRVLNGLLVTGNQEFARKILHLQSKCGFVTRRFRL